MKKGFTLAEILIVLTIIGVMAVMTIPSLIQNSNSQQKIVLFKKAFNALSNAYATEFATKTPPNGNTSKGGDQLWDALNNQLNIKYYYTSSTGFSNSNTDLSGATFTKKFSKPTSSYRNWIVSEDGIAYTTYMHTAGTVLKKLDYNNYKTTQLAKTGIKIVVDINGSEAPNKLCPDNISLNKIDCDIAVLYISLDGIATGNPDCTFAGRIMSDNTTYVADNCS